MEIINKTPHDVNIVDGEGNVIKTFKKSENPFRLTEVTEEIGFIEFDGVTIPITKTTMTSTDLPEEKIGIFYIVSRVLQEYWNIRDDLLIPNETVRDSEGKIIGCKSLAIY